jgi:pimeloyl-ACP methyl ester carboxylesterase
MMAASNGQRPNKRRDVVRTIVNRFASIASIALGVTIISAAAVPAASAALAPTPLASASANTRFLDRPQGRIAYDDSGPAGGDLVILVPGIGDLRQQYRFLAPQLTQAGYRVITTDLRGLGESSTGWDDYTGAATGSDIVTLVRELNAGPAHLVGQSNAAGAVVWAVAEAPDLVRSLTLIGPFVRDIPPAPVGDTAITWGMINLGLARPWGVSLWGTYYKSLYPALHRRTSTPTPPRSRPTSLKRGGSKRCRP